MGTKYKPTGKPNGRPPQTHCKNGHEYTEENTVYFNTKSKGRTIKQKRCKTCMQVTRNTFNAKQRAKTAIKKESWYF